MDFGPVSCLVMFLRVTPMSTVSLEQINQQVRVFSDCKLNKAVLALTTIPDYIKCCALCRRETVCESYNIYKGRCFLNTWSGKQGVLYMGRYDDPCPKSKGYISVFDPRFCYKLSQDKRSWFDSLLRCRRDGGRLLVLSDRRIYNYMHRLLFNESVSARGWVGMNKVRGKFKWLDGSSYVTKWQKGEPDYVPYQNCGILYVHPIIENDGMSDISCSDVVEYICEIQMSEDS